GLGFGVDSGGGGSNSDFRVHRHNSVLRSWGRVLPLGPSARKGLPSPDPPEFFRRTLPRFPCPGSTCRAALSPCPKSARPTRKKARAEEGRGAGTSSEEEATGGFFVGLAGSGQGEGGAFCRFKMASARLSTQPPSASPAGRAGFIAHPHAKGAQP